MQTASSTTSISTGVHSAAAAQNGNDEQLPPARPRISAFPEPPFKWGIPVDFDDKHVVYVWLDALTNYITGIGYDCDGNSTEQFKRNWPADLHLIGKDIIRFHTIYWPIFLMALDLPLPKQVFGHPWLLMNGGKMSKSKGNVIYAEDLVDLFGVDAVRYFVLHEMPFESDGTITWDLMIERTNSDLAKHARQPL